MSDVFRQTYKPMSEQTSLHILSIKGKAQELYDLLVDYDPAQCEILPWQSREASLARTKIEEAVMWATKHLTR